jgi:hypothetical protein
MGYTEGQPTAKRNSHELDKLQTPIEMGENKYGRPL